MKALIEKNLNLSELCEACGAIQEIIAKHEQAMLAKELLSPAYPKKAPASAATESKGQNKIPPSLILAQGGCLDE